MGSEPFCLTDPYRNWVHNKIWCTTLLSLRGKLAFWGGTSQFRYELYNTFLIKSRRWIKKLQITNIHFTYQVYILKYNICTCSTENIHNPRLRNPMTFHMASSIASVQRQCTHSNVSSTLRTSNLNIFNFRNSYCLHLLENLQKVF